MHFPFWAGSRSSRGLWLVLLAFTVGCESGRSDLIPVSGKLVVQGADYDPQKQEEVMVILYPDTNDGGTSYPAVFKPDGTFTIPGEDGKGVPAGKYRIAMERISDNLKQPVNVSKVFQGRDSKLVREITAESGDLGTIDVTKPPAG